jgi:hypothetical protein
MENENSSAASALASIIQILGDLDDAERDRVLRSVSSFFHHHSNFSPESSISPFAPTAPKGFAGRPDFSTDYAPSPKEFMLQKQPKTDVERVACLAYYLTHFRETPYFKTIELSKLNTEAAQPKFSNAAYATQNALNTGYLAPAIKGQRQLSAAGEQFVQALPDRDAAKAAMASARPRRSPRKKQGYEE